MLKVKLDDLKKLLPGSVSEGVENNDLGGLSFKDACTVWREGLKNNVVAQTYSHFVKAMADKCPPIMLVGEGSSRTAFACIGGLCMKAAKKEAGVD